MPDSAAKHKHPSRPSHGLGFERVGRLNDVQLSKPISTGEGDGMIRAWSP